MTVCTMTREQFITRHAQAPSCGSEMMAAADLDVYCPEHGGYRGTDCRCPAPGKGDPVRVDARFVPWNPAEVAPAEPAAAPVPEWPWQQLEVLADQMHDILTTQVALVMREAGENPDDEALFRTRCGQVAYSLNSKAGRS